MSERLGRFCDFFRNLDKTTCTVQAIGTCVFCEEDVCTAHAVHDTQGLLVRVDLRDLVTPQGVNQSPQTTTIKATSAATTVCRRCATSITQSVDLSVANDAALKAAVKSIRSALTQKALKTATKRDDFDL